MQSAVINAETSAAQTTYETAVTVMTQVLADEHVLYMKLRNYHWNVEGAYHRILHELFEEQYRIIEVRIDDVAERIRALGSTAVGTMTEYLQLTSLREHPESHLAAREMLCDLLNSHEAVIGFLTEVLAPPADPHLDVGSADLLTGLIQDHEKMAWTLRATLAEDDHARRTARAERRPVLYE